RGISPGTGAASIFGGPGRRHCRSLYETPPTRAVIAGNQGRRTHCAQGSALGFLSRGAVDTSQPGLGEFFSTIARLYGQSTETCQLSLESDGPLLDRTDPRKSKQRKLRKARVSASAANRAKEPLCQRSSQSPAARLAADDGPSRNVQRRA